MAWQLLAAALPAAAKVAGTALSKPRQEDYAPQTDYMKKYLSYIRGRSADREVLHMAMQPALRVAGKQGRQMQRQVGYDAAKAGLGGSGIESQMRLSAGQQTQEALATATDKAVAAQAVETARIGEKAADVTAQIGAEEARAKQAYETAGRQWKRQLASDVIGAGASLAGAGIQQYGQNISGFRQALTEGSVPAGTTYSQFKDMAKDGVIQGAPELGVPETELGRMSPADYAQYTGDSKEKISGLRLAERIYGSSDAVKNLRDKGISDADIISEAKRQQSMYVSAVGSGGDPAQILAALRATGFGGVDASFQPEATSGKEELDIVDDEAAKVEAAKRETALDKQGRLAYEATLERSDELGKMNVDLIAQRDAEATKAAADKVAADKAAAAKAAADKAAADKAAADKAAADKAAAEAGQPDPKVELPEGFKEGDFDTYPIKEIDGVKYHYNPKTGDPVQTVEGEVNIPKSRSDMTDWEIHLEISGGKSKYYKNEKEFLAAQAKHKAKHKAKVAKFVKPEKDPQHYIERYNKEPKYKAWFDEFYKGHGEGKWGSIYKAVGLPEPIEVQAQHIKDLTSKLPSLTGDDKSFAQNLINQYNKRETPLSERQWGFVSKLLGVSE